MNSKEQTIEQITLLLQTSSTGINGEGYQDVIALDRKSAKRFVDNILNIPNVVILQDEDCSDDKTLLLETGTKDKALLVIEAMIENNTFIDDLQLHPIKDANTNLLLRFLLDIYEIAHVATNPSCIPAHKEWVEKLESTYQLMHEAGEF